MTSTIPILFQPRRFSDERGWFSETYSARSAPHSGLPVDFVQDNQSYSAVAGTIRGLHFQIPPHGQGKLVRCLSGSIIDYAVDLRKGSPTYGTWVSAKLTATGGEQLYVPIGFAHGFITLQADTNVAYKVTDFYQPSSEGGIIWNDKTIGITWPVPPESVTLSSKDTLLATLDQFDSPFEYDGYPMLPINQEI